MQTMPKPILYQTGPKNVLIRNTLYDPLTNCMPDKPCPRNPADITGLQLQRNRCPSQGHIPPRTRTLPRPEEGLQGSQECQPATTTAPDIPLSEPEWTTKVMKCGFESLPDGICMAAHRLHEEFIPRGYRVQHNTKDQKNTVHHRTRRPLLNPIIQAWGPQQQQCVWDGRLRIPQKVLQVVQNNFVADITKMFGDYNPSYDPTLMPASRWREWFSEEFLFNSHTWECWCRKQKRLFVPTQFCRFTWPDFTNAEITMLGNMN